MPVWVTDISKCKIQTVSGALVSVSENFCYFNDLIAELK